MAATIKIKNSSTASAVPTSSDLVQGELAVNVTDKRIFTENASGTVVELGTNPSTLTVAADATIYGVKVGRGAGSVSTNTAVGASALNANTTGARNTALGNLALAGNTTTTYSDATAIGYNALYQGGGGKSTAVGAGALSTENASGGTNVGVGYNALTSDSSGGSNVAVGAWALQANTTASNNTAVGYQALYSNTTGFENTAVGYQALNANTTASYNTAVGRNSLYLTTTGTHNTCIGHNSGYNISTGTKNTILGRYDGNQGGLDIRTASNYIVLSDGDGNPQFWINNSGRPFLPGLGSDAGTNTVKFNTGTGRLSYDTSSSRYKDNIRDSIYGLSHVMQMRSTQFEYKEGGRSDVGLIAEELNPIIPELVGKNAEGQPDSVSYDRIVSVLVKAIQELKAEFDAYKATHP